MVEMVEVVEMAEMVETVEMDPLAVVGEMVVTVPEVVMAATFLFKFTGTQGSDSGHYNLSSFGLLALVVVMED